MTVKLDNITRDDRFCKDCPISSPVEKFAQVINEHNLVNHANMVEFQVEFEHGCHMKVCSSRLTLTAVAKYNGQPIAAKIVEGLHHTIDVDLTVVNRHETAINTVVVIQMSPLLLPLTNSGDADSCVQFSNTSSYKCNIHKVLQTNGVERRYLHFNVSRFMANRLDIDFKVETDSKVESGSKVTDKMQFEVIRRASVKLKKYHGHF